MNIILLAAVVSSSLAHPGTLNSPPNGVEVAMMCMKTGEQSSGMNKICYYNCAGSNAAITVSATELCPLTINN
ncbi:hypothetical protein LP421_10525 [Rhizobium sp. RCAM05350]|nr:hypothetical protein LP421_10525 [Rhizobium sp. RCAM05350]